MGKPVGVLLALFWVFLLASCGGGSSPSEPSPTPPRPPTTPPPPTPPTPTALSNPIPAAIEVGDIQVKAVDFASVSDSIDETRPSVTTTPYARIRYMQQAIGLPERFFFSDSRGTLWVYEEAWEETRTFLDLRDQNVGFSNATYPNESGLLGFAFHPEFAEVDADGYGKLYTAYSATPSSGTANFIESASSVQESVLVEWQVNDHLETEFSGTNRELLRIGQFAANHNIGSIAFNPTATKGSDDFGNLYVTLGDGGGAHDPQNHGQRPSTVLGTILRINPLGGVEGESAYGIPADNPFADGVDGLPEVWAYGVRHPQHLSWDYSTGQMYFIDIGQDQIEEVNQGVVGGNYGWRIREGTFATAHGVTTSDQPTSVYERPEDTIELIYPVAQYDHDEGFAISSGFVYRGSAISELMGMFVISELARGRLFYVDVETFEEGTPATVKELQVTVGESDMSLLDVSGYPNSFANHRPYDRRVDLRLSTDLRGELYVSTMGDGQVRKLVAK